MVTGTETAGQFCGSPGTYPLHFVAQFDRPFSSYGTWHTAPTGTNVFTQPTGQLDWSYHEVNSGGTPATVAPATPRTDRAPSRGSSPTRWPTPGSRPRRRASMQGDSYQASVTLQGSGQVYLNFYNGQQDVGGTPVTLTSTPVTRHRGHHDPDRIDRRAAVPGAHAGCRRGEPAGVERVDQAGHGGRVAGHVVDDQHRHRTAAGAGGTERQAGDRRGGAARPGGGRPVPHPGRGHERVAVRRVGQLRRVEADSRCR